LLGSAERLTTSGGNNNVVQLLAVCKTFLSKKFKI